MISRLFTFVGMLIGVACICFAIGFQTAQAQGSKKSLKSRSQAPKIVYPEETQLDFEGVDIEGQLNQPGEFYFESKPPEKFGSLVERRKNFHREMLRDALMSR